MQIFLKKLQISARDEPIIEDKTMTVCSYHVTYVFQSESTLYSGLNVKELPARSRRKI